MDGWIKLYRNIQDHWMWKEEPYDKARAWIDLIMLANYEDKKTAYKGEIITCKRGDVNLSISYLAKRWKWSRDKTSRFIDLLEKDGMVTSNRTKHRTTITIENYGFYQDLPSTDNATNKATSRQQADITKKEKKDKKIIYKANSNQAKKNQFSVIGNSQEYDIENLEQQLIGGVNNESEYTINR